MRKFPESHVKTVMRSPNLRHLEIFRTLIQTLSVTETASLLNVSQPAVSKAMAQLQATVGLKLFNRIHGRLQPSGDGLRLLAETERLLNQVSLFDDEVLALRGAHHGRLAVAAIPALAIGAIAGSVGAFRVHHPKVQIEFHMEMSARIVDLVSQHRIELAFIHGAPQNANIRTELLGESEIACQFRADHPLASKQIITAPDIKDEDLVFLDPGSPPNHLIRENFARAGIHPQVVTEINASHLAGHVVSVGGVAFVDRMSAGSDGRVPTVCRPFRPRVALRVYAIWPAHRPLARVAKEFLDIATRQVVDGCREIPGGTLRPTSSS